MLTTVMKYFAIVVLLAGMFWRIAPNLRSYLDFVVSAAAIFVLVQAAKLREYSWVAAFGAIFFFFNPIRPISFSFGTKVALQILTAAIFVISLLMLKTGHRMTIASIAEENPKTESL